MRTIRQHVFLLLAVFAGAAGAYAAGYRTPPHPMLHLTNAVAAASGRRLLKAANDALPAKYDLRNEDGAGTSYLTPVRDQGVYGTCWAHAAMAGIEYLMRRDEGIAADLSENNLANMHGYPLTFEEGGTTMMATSVFLREDGPTTEALDPYSSIGTSRREHGVRTPRKVVFVPARSPKASEAQLKTDNDVIKRALLKYGPLVTSYYHDYYYLKGAAYYCRYDYGANHAVSIVGWDDDYPAANFRLCPPGNGAFIVKNSWGASEFEQGYTYISYYDATFGFEPQIAYARLSKGEDYGRRYEHDPFGHVTQMGYGSETAHAMNVFTARADEQLAAFGVYALAANTAYSAKVVVNPVVVKGKLQGTEYAVASGVAADAGYEVYDFSEPVSVGAGSNFAIVVTLKTPGFTAPVAITCNDYFLDGSPYVDGVVAVPGRSYICDNPSRDVWQDISAEAKYFCCKVYTKALSPDATTCGEVPVLHRWLDVYSANHGAGGFLANSFYGAYNALSEHIGANGRTVGESYARGLDPDNAAETNLVATIAFDAEGSPVIDVLPRNDALWNYTTLGSEDLRSWHPKAAADVFFKVTVSPK